MPAFAPPLRPLETGVLFPRDGSASGELVPVDVDFEVLEADVELEVEVVFAAGWRTKNPRLDNSLAFGS